MIPLSNPLRRRHIPTLLGFAVGVLLSCCVVCGKGLQTPKWLHAEADVRLHVLPASLRPHTLLVPLPKSLWGYADVAVAGRIGGLPCRAVFIDSKLQAVEISLSSSAARRMSRDRGVSGGLQVYLFKKYFTSDAPAHAPTPVLVRTSQDKVTARPGTAAEFLQYQRSQPSMITRGEVAAMPARGYEYRLQMGSGRSSGRRRYKTRAAFSTYLRVTAPTTFEFSVATAHCGPWYLLVNDQPVFSWGQFVRQEGEAVSKPVAVKAGLQKLDFFTILAKGEVMPELRVRERHRRGAFRALSTAELFSARTAMGVCVERRNDILSPGVIVEQQRTFACRGTNTLLAVLSVQDFSQQWFDRKILKQSIGIDAGPMRLFEESEIRLMVRNPAGNQLTIQAADALGEKRRLTAPVHPDWTLAQDAVNRLQIFDLPLLEPVGEPLFFRYRTTIAEELTTLVRDRGKIVLRRWDDADRPTKKTALDYPKSPFEQQISIADLSTEGARIGVSLELGGAPIAPSQNVYLVDPGDPLLFVASESQLRYRDGFAVLRRLQKSSGPAAAVPQQLSGKIALVDDFIGTSRHAYDDFPLSSWQWSSLGDGLQLMHVSLNVSKQASVRHRLKKFSVLKRLVEAKPAVVVWAVGMQDLLAGMDLRDFRSQLIFITEVFRVHKIPLVLVTLPPEGQLSEERARACALVTKELAISCKTPVVDFYSETRRQGSIERFWRIKGRRDLRSATPNAEGRRWFCAAIANVFGRLATTKEGK